MCIYVTSVKIHQISGKNKLGQYHDVDKEESCNELNVVIESNRETCQGADIDGRVDQNNREAEEVLDR